MAGGASRWRLNLNWVGGPPIPAHARCITICVSETVRGKQPSATSLRLRLQGCGQHFTRMHAEQTIGLPVRRTHHPTTSPPRHLAAPARHTPP